MAVPHKKTREMNFWPFAKKRRWIFCIQGPQIPQNFGKVFNTLRLRPFSTNSVGNARGRTRSAKLGLRHKVAQGHGSVTRHFSKWCPPIEKVRTCPKRVQVLHLILSHRIHIWCISVWYIFLYIYHKNQANVSKYTGPLDPMGINPESTVCCFYMDLSETQFNDILKVFVSPSSTAHWRSHGNPSVKYLQ